jgi:hypothetical protein
MVSSAGCIGPVLKQEQGYLRSRLFFREVDQPTSKCYKKKIAF